MVVIVRIARLGEFALLDRLGMDQGGARQASGFVKFRDVAFRCKQPLDGFLRRSPDQIDLLLQPINMDPRDVAKCTCTFDVEADVVAKGTVAFSGFVRGDNYGGVQEPKQVGETVILDLKK